MRVKIEQTVILRKSQSINCVVVRIAPSQTFLRGDLENNTKACVATHHPVIGGLGFFERKNLTAEAYLCGLAHLPAVLRSSVCIQKGSRNNYCLVADADETRPPNGTQIPIADSGPALAAAGRAKRRFRLRAPRRLAPSKAPAPKPVAAGRRLIILRSAARMDSI
jgi:hypothetical protein